MRGGSIILYYTLKYDKVFLHSPGFFVLFCFLRVRLCQMWQIILQEDNNQPICCLRDYSHLELCTQKEERDIRWVTKPRDLIAYTRMDAKETKTTIPDKDENINRTICSLISIYNYGNKSCTERTCEPAYPLPLRLSSLSSNHSLHLL